MSRPLPLPLLWLPWAHDKEFLFCSERTGRKHKMVRRHWIFIGNKIQQCEGRWRFTITRGLSGRFLSSKHLPGVNLFIYWRPCTVIDMTDACSSSSVSSRRLAAWTAGWRRRRTEVARGSNRRRWSAPDTPVCMLRRVQLIWRAVAKWSTMSDAPATNAVRYVLHMLLLPLAN